MIKKANSSWVIVAVWAVSVLYGSVVTGKLYIWARKYSCHIVSITYNDMVLSQVVSDGNRFAEEVVSVKFILYK